MSAELKWRSESIKARSRRWNCESFTFEWERSSAAQCREERDQWYHHSSFWLCVCVREREWVRLRHLRLQVSCPWSATSLFGAFSCSLISPSEVPFSLSVRPIFLPSTFFLLFSLVVLNNGFLLVTLTGDFIVLLWVCLACVWYID